VAGLTLEDTLLPRPFSEGGGERLMISVEEGALKLAAAIEARADRDLVIVARTSACMLEGVEAACIRAAAYAAVGVDGIFVAGARTRDELLAVSQAAGGLPLLAYNVGGEIAPDADLVSAGVRLLVLGHDPFSAAVSAGYAALASQRSQQPGSETPAQLVAWLSEADRYAERSESYLTKRREP
jgi:oxaloacetate decarboxylase